LQHLAAFSDARACAEFFITRPAGEEPVEIMPHAVEASDKSLVLAYPGDELHPRFPGKAGQRHRMHVLLPMGGGGFRLESNLDRAALTRASAGPPLAAM
jgi:hypothetical protein